MVKPPWQYAFLLPVPWTLVVCGSSSPPIPYRSYRGLTKNTFSSPASPSIKGGLLSYTCCLSRQTKIKNSIILSYSHTLAKLVNQNRSLKKKWIATLCHNIRKVKVRPVRLIILALTHLYLNFQFPPDRNTSCSYSGTQKNCYKVSTFCSHTWRSQMPFPGLLLPPK